MFVSLCHIRFLFFPVHLMFTFYSFCCTGNQNIKFTPCNTTKDGISKNSQFSKKETLPLSGFFLRTRKHSFPAVHPICAFDARFSGF